MKLDGISVLPAPDFSAMAEIFIEGSLDSFYPSHYLRRQLALIDDEC
jgi:hypothetical protein